MRERLLPGETHLWTHTIRIDNGNRRRRFQLTPMLGGLLYRIKVDYSLLYPLPDGCMVGAGSVVTRSFPPAAGRLLIAGNPAIVCKTYAPVAAPPVEQV